MYRYRKIVQLCVFILIVLLAFDIDYNPFVKNDVGKLSHQVVHVTKTKDPLYQEIKQKKSKYSKEPQNATVDKIWKKTPGRNGVEVDVEESYKQMKKEGNFDESKLVYKQIPPKVQFRELPASPVYRGHPEKEMVAFLINVSWGEEHIPEILDTLNEHNVKATFFIEGEWAKKNADLVKMINEQGHLIGNHAYNHPDMARLSNQEIIQQITQTNTIIEAIIDKTPRWFAPPSGSFKNNVVKTAHNLKMETILWTVDTIDWKNPSVSVMMNRVMTDIHPGATILMHPTSSVVEGLSPLIKDIKKKGYKIGTIEQLLNEEREI
ncbi:polysaccharide deacetylase family protein [Virgibacillus alimentarius]|uniref:Sporulation protein (Polysaccharide deacetylase family) n=1 Tax=Virgibacillus alimentarius TaxID=698769 RepID=A0ABS4S498_9BACI|nr:MULTISPECIES: polysaccharide deacetylase family protein [Virgibacillus]MBP2256239.1 putative sporulation protein (polysaccharide deacetylase family) [Virgibacillus alimentarius]HLR66186.1 polysaccharide deacetylase family protein [Virgibacillus sp.]